MSGQSITEKWEYDTKIITSYDGHEQRIKVRQYPRHFISYDYPAMNSYEAQWLRGLGRVRQSDTYYIPMWHSPVHLRESHIAGKALYIRSEDMMALDNCEYIEIFVRGDVNQSGVNTVRQVYEYLDGIIGLTQSIDKPLDKLNTWIYPIKKFSVQPMNGLQYIWSNGSNVTHNFEDLLLVPAKVHIPKKYLSDYEYYEGWNRWNFPESDGTGKQILLFEPQWVGDNSVVLSVEKNVNRLDNETGVFKYDLRNTKSTDIHTWELTLMNRSAISNMIRFFKRVEGRRRAFLAPTWVNDLNIVQDIKSFSNHVYTDWRTISNFYLTNKRDKKFVIFTKDWHWYVLDVWTYGEERIGEERFGKIILKNPAGFDLDVSNILMTSYLNLVRLDSDELQLNYETDSIANITLVMREVDEIEGIGRYD